MLAKLPKSDGKVMSDGKTRKPRNMQAIIGMFVFHSAANKGSTSPVLPSEDAQPSKTKADASDEELQTKIKADTRCARRGMGGRGRLD